MAIKHLFLKINVVRTPEAKPPFPPANRKSEEMMYVANYKYDFTVFYGFVHFIYESFHLFFFLSCSILLSREQSLEELHKMLD